MRTAAAGIIAALLIITATPLLAKKHTFSADYDVGKPLSMSGKINKIDWANPRTWLTFEVTSPDGTKTLWTGEGRELSVLSKKGLSKPMLEQMFHVGEMVTVMGFSSLNGSPRIYATSAVKPDGKTLEFGPPPMN